MPADVLNKISTDVRRALADAEVRKRLINTGSAPMDMAPADFARFVRSEIEDSKKVAAAAGIKPQ
jgi:tripartite-type tricarboxylate transporter receptor subunit TctC